MDSNDIRNHIWANCSKPMQRPIRPMITGMIIGFISTIMSIVFFQTDTKGVSARTKLLKRIQKNKMPM